MSSFRKGTHMSSFRKGTHALRKRCPLCKKLRRFYEPPHDQGGERPSRAKWVKINERWICVYCAEKNIYLDDAEFIQNHVGSSATVKFTISGVALSNLRRIADETNDNGSFKKFLEILLTEAYHAKNS